MALVAVCFFLTHELSVMNTIGSQVSFPYHFQEEKNSTGRKLVSVEDVLVKLFNEFSRSLKIHSKCKMFNITLINNKKFYEDYYTKMEAVVRNKIYITKARALKEDFKNVINSGPRWKMRRKIQKQVGDAQNIDFSESFSCKKRREASKDALARLAVHF